jgi:hypothetical protein
MSQEKEVAMTEYNTNQISFLGHAQAMGASSWSMMNQGSGCDPEDA